MKTTTPEILLTRLQTPLFTLRNRVVMAPMSRRRANNRTISSSAPLYYGQRATAGLIIAENTAVAPDGVGYFDAHGIYNSEQLAAWKAVVDAVHARGGKIFIQLVHAGRIGHPLNHEGEAPLIAPSAVRAEELISVPDGRRLPVPTPRALGTSEVDDYIEAHVKAARSAVAIGFDGVEVHGAHGYLPNQFLHPHTNRRTDRYGGNIENRSRFLLETVERVSAAIGKERTGVRLSPFVTLNDLPPYSEEPATLRYLADALNKLDIFYLHLSAFITDGVSTLPVAELDEVRRRFQKSIILAGSYTAASAEEALRSGQADLIAFGRPFISNPDLVHRFKTGATLRPWDESLFYTGGDRGYIDYEPLQSELRAS